MVFHGRLIDNVKLKGGSLQSPISVCLIMEKVQSCLYGQPIVSAPYQSTVQHPVCGICMAMGRKEVSARVSEGQGARERASARAQERGNSLGILSFQDSEGFQ